MPLHIRRIQLRWLGHVQLVGGPGADPDGTGTPQYPSKKAGGGSRGEGP